MTMKKHTWQRVFEREGGANLIKLHLSLVERDILGY